MEYSPPRRLRLLAIGLILTFLGLLMASLLIPPDASHLGRGLMIGAAGLASLWLGGLLLGRASGRRRPPGEVRS